MDFELSPEMTELRRTVRRLAQEKIKPRAREIDSTGEYPQDIFEELQRADLLGLCIPEEYGGSGAGITGLTIAIEEVTKYSNVIGLMLLLTRLPTGPIMIAGNEEQKQKYLPGIANGSQRAAFCLSEPGAGSDVAGMRTHAAPDPDEEDGFVLNGTKCWISGGMQADWFVVFAKVGDPTLRQHRNIFGFIVAADSPGVTRPRVDEKMGVKGIDTTEIVFEDVKVGPRDVIGGGFLLAMQSLNAMRPIVAARGLGLAEGALMYATDYVKERQAFGQTIADFQGIRWEIAKCATDIEAARLLTYRAAWLADHGLYAKEHVPMLSMAKYYATEVAVRASGLAVQLLGAAGYMHDHPVEQYYRDAKQLTIVEGTSQVQLNLIGQGVVHHDLWWD
ncbi:MAG TPA: acyl-CoA dehydrogenase family protein [Acidimicrobiales bacterium]|nr:acyl-CoA dehydrogenase family protein [Acidimicrobiales bacterium]